MDAIRIALVSVALFAASGMASGTEDQYAPLKEAAKESFARFELKPYPPLRIISEPGHLERGELARAVLYESGREEIWLSADALKADDLWIILDHEVGHLRTWRDHGPGVLEHGAEFRRTCRKYALSLKACEDKR